jgi:hypothetical protein
MPSTATTGPKLRRSSLTSIMSISKKHVPIVVLPFSPLLIKTFKFIQKFLTVKTHIQIILLGINNNN